MSCLLLLLLVCSEQCQRAAAFPTLSSLLAPSHSRPGEGREICTWRLSAELIMQHSSAREAHSSIAVSFVSLLHEKGERNRLPCCGAGTLNSTCFDAGSSACAVGAPCDL